MSHHCPYILEVYDWYDEKWGVMSWFADFNMADDEAERYAKKFKVKTRVIEIHAQYPAQYDGDEND